MQGDRRASTDPGSAHDTAALANGDRLAPRPTSLQGQRLGLVCNGLNDSEYLFDRLAAILEEQEASRPRSRS